MPDEVDFEWTDYEGKPIETEVIRKEPVSPTEASDEFLRLSKISKAYGVIGVMSSAQTLWIIRDALSRQDPVISIVGILAGINAVNMFRGRQQIEKEIKKEIEF